MTIPPTFVLSVVALIALLVSATTVPSLAQQPNAIPQTKEGPSGATLAAQKECTGAVVDVVASLSEEHNIACSAARDAFELLGRCEIFARKRVSVHILSMVDHPQSGQVFGFFDLFQQRAIVTRLSNIPLLVKDTPYALLPREVFCRSLIVHEIVHAVMHQNLVRPTTTRSAHEYPAYALQIESLPAELRHQFLQSFDQQDIQSTALFSDPVLMFDPFFFAARAYHHFKASDDGCANLKALLQGDVDFIASGNL